MKLIEFVGSILAVIILGMLAVTIVTLIFVAFCSAIGIITGFDLIHEVIRPFFQGLHLR